MYRPYSLLAIALLAGCGEEFWREIPAMADDYGVPRPAGGAASALETGSAGSLQSNTPGGETKANLDSRAAVPPAMFAALQDLSKKSIADGGVAKSQSQAAPKTVPSGSESGKTVQLPTPPRIQPQHKTPPDQQAGFRARRSPGPASKIEALRERMHHAPSFLRRHGFHRAG